MLKIVKDQSQELGSRKAICEQIWKRLAMVWPSRYGEHGAGGMAELLPLLEAPRTGDDAKDITPPTEPVIMEQDPLYTSYVAWGRALAEAKEEG